MTLLRGRKILVNMVKVERINSCGVRDWVRWLQSLESRDNTIHLVACSPAVVAQLNMVRNFCGARGHVVSFQAPYYCETCDREHRETFLSSSLGTTSDAPLALCESCGEPMTFDDMEASYFAFLRDHGSRTVDPEVQAAMNKFEDVHLATKVAALKEISSGTRIGATPVSGGGSAAGGAPSERPLTGANANSSGASFASMRSGAPNRQPERPLAADEATGVGLKK